MAMRIASGHLVLVIQELQLFLRCVAFFLLEGSYFMTSESRAFIISV